MAACYAPRSGQSDWMPILEDLALGAPGWHSEPGPGALLLGGSLRVPLLMRRVAALTARLPLAGVVKPALSHAAAPDPAAWLCFLSRSASAMNRMPKTIE
jgi:hypothetical protein